MTTTQANIPLDEALGVLRDALDANSIAGPQPLPSRLRRDEISRMVAVFQPRAIDGQLGIDEAHLSELEYAIGNPENPKLLDAITVWWGGDRYYVIDGHHRLIAYERKGIRGSIPVEVFEGTLDQAMARTAALNSKNRLPMRQEDKLNFAWRLTLASVNRHAILTPYRPPKMTPLFCAGVAGPMRRSHHTAQPRRASGAWVTPWS